MANSHPICLIVHKLCKDRQTTAKTENQHKRNNKIKNDVRLVRFARLAVVLRAAALTFDMGEHVGTECAAPPCVTDFLCVALSAIGAGGILSCWLHVFLQNEW